MKKIYPALIIGIMIFFSCAQKEKSPDGIGRKDIIILTDRQMTNFINILPVLLKFSESYNLGLSLAQRDATNADLKFFDALANDISIKKSLSTYSFASMDELISVYKNVVLEYTTITRDFTNYSKDLESLEQTIGSLKSNYMIGLHDKSLSEDDRKIIMSRLKDLNEDEKRVSNIIMVKKYEKQINNAYLNREKN